ncbi:rab-like protein 6 [Anneissia japonica]|uniref:rab-like protein 6 n=1 Tax=Anneissia japonica TaxID=1529436 RepID=UPI0014258C95|nr:rab-like protein 6 [Anneissia japonica]
MFSALKKIITNEPTDGKGKPPSGGFQAMGQNLQRRFAKGVQYNMKIIIKGDRNVGKTTLFHRLQGHKFKEEYIPTQEIQVCSIQWNYKACGSQREFKATDDVVKVEVWDVVDKGRSKKTNDALKISNEEVEEPVDEPCLDAEFLDVYKGTNGVVMLMDITKHWTFNYIERELPKIPNHIPVVVLANFRDMAEHRTVLEEHISTFVEEFERPPGSAHVRYAESSMKNGFGLKYLHTFFNVPFLQLQRETLLRQLQTNQLEADATLEELNMRLESEDQNYNLYLETLEMRRKQRQNRRTPEKLTNGTPQITVDHCTTSSQSTTPISTPNQSSPASTPQRTTPSTSPSSQRRNSQRNESPLPELSTPSPPPAAVAQASITSRFGKFFSSKKSSKESIEVSATDNSPLDVPTPTKDTVHDVDDFIPDGGAHNDFWKDVEKTSKKVKKTTIKQEMYNSFQEDLDSDDEANFPSASNAITQSSPTGLATNDSASDTETPPKTTFTSKDIDLSSSEDEQPVISEDVDIDISDFKTEVKKFSSTKPAADIGSKKPRMPKQESLPPPVESSDDEDDSDVEQAAQKSRTSSTDQEPMQSPPPVINLDLDDLDFLESVGSKNNKTKKLHRRVSDEFDILVSVKESKLELENDVIDSSHSDADTTSTNSSTKKKKHKSKDRDRRKEKSSEENDGKTKKHKHKKSKDRDRESKKDTDPERRKSKDKSENANTGEKKKKKKSKKVEVTEDPDMDAFEAFLEGTGDGNYEAF